MLSLHIHRVRNLINSFNRLNQAFLAVAFFGMACSVASASNPSCFNPTPYDVGVQPSCVVMADLNGDGIRDLAVADHDVKLDNRVAILINNGNGTFAPSVYYTAGDRPYWIALADIDGDNDNDLAVTNFFGVSVSVMYNNGDGTFAPQIQYTSGGGPGFVVLAKLDNDAHLDMACGNIFDDTLSVFINNGDGTFAPHVTYPCGPGPYGLVAADLDNDGPLDLAISNHHLDTVSVVHNNGDGTFGAPTVYTVHAGPVGIDAGDLNNDGWRDLICANCNQAATGTTISVMMNNGDGTFAAHVPYTVPAGPYTIKIADFNADGYGDLVTSCEGDAVSILLNNGDGTHAAPTNFTIGSRPVGMDAGDLDGNSTPEVAITAYDSDEIWVLFNEYAGIVSQPQSIRVDVGESATFTVIPGGPGPFTYQWRRNAVDLNDGGPIIGANSDTLTINPVALSDADTYDVIVTNACGPVISDSAMLSVNVPCFGDIAPLPSGNNVVNVDDLLAVINGWGACPPPCPAVGACPADIVQNCVVNVDDLLAVINSWGACP